MALGMQDMDQEVRGLGSGGDTEKGDNQEEKLNVNRQSNNMGMQDCVGVLQCMGIFVLFLIKSLFVAYYP